MLGKLNIFPWLEKFPHLYDQKCGDFKNKTAKDNAWLLISGQLKIPGR